MSYADAAARNSNGSAGSLTSSTSSAPLPANTIGNNKACEIRVNIRNDTVSQELRRQQKPAQHIVDLVNAYCAKTSDDVNNGALSTAKWVRAARILRSGDVVLQAVDPPTAERLVYRSEEWQLCFGRDAKVQATTYGVVISNIPIEGINMSDQSHIIEAFSSDNCDLIGDAKITEYTG